MAHKEIIRRIAEPRRVVTPTGIEPIERALSVPTEAAARRRLIPCADDSAWDEV